MVDAKFPPDTWDNSQKLDWLIHAFGNHMKSHTRFTIVIIGAFSSVILGLLSIIHF